jgi:hypothetical protein
MAVVQTLAGYEWTGLLARHDFAYRREVQEWFAPHKEHAAVKRFNELARKGYTFDGPAGTMVCLGPLPELTLLAKAEECGAGRAGGVESLEAWLAQLRDFVKASRFGEFFDQHQAFYGQLAEETRANIRGNYAKHLEDYFGARQESYRIVLAPLLVGNFGPRVPRGDGRYDIYGVLGQTGVADGRPRFGSEESLRYLVWHEFGHSFVNPEVDRHQAQVEKSAKLFDPIAQSMRRQAYANWMTTVREHVVRAMTVRLAYLHLGAEGGVRELKQERNRGFVHVPALAARLEKEYESDRRRYPTFAAFTPRLLAVFDEALANPPADLYEISFDGTMQGAFGLAPKVVFIVPTGEEDAAAQGAIRKYVERIREKIFKDAEILEDTQALERDLKGLTPLVYGTLAGNKWLARHAALLPVRLPETGASRMIAAMPHPQDPKRGAMVYTARTAAGVEGLNGIFHGGAIGYLWAEGQQVVKRGRYVERGGVYTPEGQK